LVIIDEAVFNECYCHWRGLTLQIDPTLVQQGYLGGIRAGLRILEEADNWLVSPTKVNKLSDSKLIHIYTSLASLQAANGTRHGENIDLMSQFLQGINSVSGALNLVDVGSNNTALSDKIKGIRLSSKLILQSR